VEHCTHEARGLDVLPQTIHRFRSNGDADTAQLLEVRAAVLLEVQGGLEGTGIGQASRGLGRSAASSSSCRVDVRLLLGQRALRAALQRRT
jgi:Protein of unknown function (DUF455)